jgi:hypothetical protein
MTPMPRASFVNNPVAQYIEKYVINPKAVPQQFRAELLKRGRALKKIRSHIHGKKRMSRGDFKTSLIDAGHDKLTWENFDIASFRMLE